MAKDEMIRQHHQLSGCEFEQAPRVGNGQEAWLAALDGCKELDITKRLSTQYNVASACLKAL